MSDEYDGPVGEYNETVVLQEGRPGEQRRLLAQHMRSEGMDTMNRECRRKHVKYWRAQELKSGARLVVCEKCNGHRLETRK